MGAVDCILRLDGNYFQGKGRGKGRGNSLVAKCVCAQYINVKNEWTAAGIPVAEAITLDVCVN